MNLCPPCEAEAAEWLSAPVLPQERRVYSRADKTSDLLQLSHDRYASRVRAQLRLIRDHCQRQHTKEASDVLPPSR